MDRKPTSPLIWTGGKALSETDYNKMAEEMPITKLWSPTASASLPSFTDVMGFSGSPEIVNGRLAMMGFVAAVGAELSSGELPVLYLPGNQELNCYSQARTHLWIASRFWNELSPLSCAGESVLRQLAEEPTGIIALFLLIIAGSLVPAFLNNKPSSFGPLTPNAEIINGRGAMIGFAAMLLIEGNIGHALFWAVPVMDYITAYLE
jgi:hypothetical protein